MRKEQLSCRYCKTDRGDLDTARCTELFVPLVQEHMGLRLGHFANPTMGVLGF